MAKLYISKLSKKVPKKYQKDYDFNKHGNCYFVDSFDKKGNLTWSGMYSLKSDALAWAKYEKKDKRNSKVRIVKYSK